MTRLEIFDGIEYLGEGIVEVTIRQGDPDEFVEEVKRIVRGNGYDITEVLSEGNIYYIHYE